MVSLQTGFHEVDRGQIAEMFWDAFGGKLGPILNPRRKARTMIAAGLRQDHAICAYDGAQILGVIGFKTYAGSLVDGGLNGLLAAYGLPGGLWRAGALRLLQRDFENERFVIDGIFVSPKARNIGLGTRLLHSIYCEARLRGFREIRLDVAESNSRARKLYQREGFCDHAIDTMGILRPWLGFGSTITMVRPL